MACRVDFDFASPYGVFGSPFIRIDGSPFWGSDRFDDVAERLVA